MQCGCFSTSPSCLGAQICAQAVTFLLAGYETTANALAFTTYLLAANPETEAKMLEEIDAFGRDIVPGYDDLAKVPSPRVMLLSRLYPLGLFTLTASRQTSVEPGP